VFEVVYLMGAGGLSLGGSPQWPDRQRQWMG